MASFLPEGTKEPVKSNYLTFQEGKNTFRVLGSSVVGWEYWTEEIVDGVKKSKPHRVTKEETIPIGEVVFNKYGNLNINYFWAFPVYNVMASKIQILEITQKSVRDAIRGYLDNKLWGDPRDYNFEVTRSKSADGKTQYQTIAEPKEKLDPEITKRFEAMKIDMQVWMACGDPFAITNQEPEVNDEETEEIFRA